MLIFDDYCHFFAKIEFISQLEKSFIQSAEADGGDGNIPLQRVLRYCKHETRAIKLLLDCKGVAVIKINFINEMNDALLHIAVRNSHCRLSTVKFFIDRGCKVDQVNTLRQIPLNIAVMNYFLRPNIFPLLLRKGYPVNVKDKVARTPLRSSVFKSHNANIPKMLVAGAQIGIAEDCQEALLLKDVLFECDIARKRSFHERFSKMLACFKLLVKYSFIECPNFEIEPLIQGHEDYKMFLDFASKSACEVREMESKDIGHGRTLLEFVRACPISQVNSEDYDFNQLLRICTDNEFSMYFDIISAKVGRLFMKKKLGELLVYIVKNRDYYRPSLSATFPAKTTNRTDKCYISNYRIVKNYIGIPLFRLLFQAKVFKLNN